MYYAPDLANFVVIQEASILMVSKEPKIVRLPSIFTPALLWLLGEKDLVFGAQNTQIL